MTDYNLEDCQFDHFAEKLKYRKIWGNYSKQVRVRVKKGTVYITSNGVSRVLFSGFIRHIDPCCIIASDRSTSSTYKFSDENITSHFFNAITPFEGKNCKIPINLHVLINLYRPELGHYKSTGGLSIFGQFLAKLPAHLRVISQETQDLLKQKMYFRLAAVDNERDALELLADAEAHPRKATALHMEEQLQVVLTGEFIQPGLDGTVLLKAFSKIDGSPKMVKMGGAGDFDKFSQLHLSSERAEKLHLVCIEGKFEENETAQSKADPNAPFREPKNAAVMKSYACSLDAVPYLPETVLLDRLASMVQTLQFLHGTDGGTRPPLFHNDVKGENIFVSESGDWFLGDYGCMCERDEDLHRITAAYVPLDTVVTPSAALDIWMLVVAVLLKIKNKKLSVRSRFTQRH